MKTIAAIILTLFLAPAAFAGGGNFDDMPQQQMAQQEEVSNNDWVVPVSVAVVTGVFGLGAALVVSRRRRE